MKENKELIGVIVFIIIIAAAIFFVINAIEDYKEKRANTIPDPPSALNIISRTSQKISLEWGDEADNELGYRIYRDGFQIAELSKDTESYTDCDVTPTTLYEYVVVAYNKAGESDKAIRKVKSKNPAVIVRLDKIGVRDNGEDYFRELVDGHGEIYLGVIISDGITTQTRRLPADGFYFQKDNSERLMNTVIYSTTSVEEYLEIHILGLEHDYSGLGDDLLIEALNYVITGSMGTIPSLILAVANVDFTKEITEIGGFRDEFLGEYNNYWPASDNWGIGEYYAELDNGDGKIGLQLWFAIENPTGK